MATILAIAAVLLILAGGGYWLYSRGRKVERGAALEDTIDAVEKANRHRDRLRSDPDYAQRVRDRFTR